jgi:hypothetical protein
VRSGNAETEEDLRHSLLAFSEITIGSVL